MAKFCGKCGTHLDKKTGLCPECDRAKNIELHAEKVRKKKQQFMLTIVAFSVLFAIIGIILYNANNTAETPSENTEYGSLDEIKMTNTPLDPIDAYLRDEIFPLYPQQKDVLTIPYRARSCMEGNVQHLNTFFEIPEGPVALLGTNRADYNGDGVEDLLVVSLDARESMLPGSEKYNDLEAEGLHELEINTSVYYFDETGTAKPRGSMSQGIRPELKSVMSLSSKEERLIWHRASDYGSGKHKTEGNLYFPITDCRQHEDEVIVTNLRSNSSQSEYDFSRDISNDKSFVEVNYAENVWSDGERERLYNSIPGKYSIKFDSEIEACKHISSTLYEKCRINDLTVAPHTWENRWSNTFLPSPYSDKLVCSITMQSTVSEQISGTETGGTTTFYFNQSSDEKQPEVECGTFAFLPRHFDVCGSNHATGSGFNLNPDGTFTCDWIFWDWGDWADEYPDGTCQISKFRGKFSNLMQVDEHTYKMTLDYSEQWDQIGREYIENNKRYIVYDWDRFDGIKEVYVYLPGTKYDFSTAGVVSIGDKELFDLPPYDVDWEELFGHGCVLHIDGMPAFISEDYDVSLNETNSVEKENILASTLDFSKKWSYLSQYRVYPDNSGKYYLQDYRACFTFSEDGTMYLLVYEPYSDVYFGYDGSYTVIDNNIEFTIYSNGESWTHLYRFDPADLTLTQLSENGLVTSIDPKGTVHHLEVDPFNN